MLLCLFDAILHSFTFEFVEKMRCFEIFSIWNAFASTMRPLCVLLLFLPHVLSWPDGAPCLQNNIRSMYPSSVRQNALSERLLLTLTLSVCVFRVSLSLSSVRVEHAGGEIRSDSPYEIWTSSTCYRPHRSILRKRFFIAIRHDFQAKDAFKGVVLFHPTCYYCLCSENAWQKRIST